MPRPRDRSALRTLGQLAVALLSGLAAGAEHGCDLSPRVSVHPGLGHGIGQLHLAPGNSAYGIADAAQPTGIGVRRSNSRRVEPPLGGVGGLLELFAGSGHPVKLDKLLGARLYRKSEQDVLVIDTKSLLDAHEARVRLSPINSGATLYPNATARGSDTFTTIEDYPYAERRRKRTVPETVTELAVIEGVHDVRDHVIRVERRRGREVLERYPV
jgi:hypothetical protein